MIKIRFLFEGNFEVQGKSVHFKKGDHFMASEEDAARLLKELCAERADDKPLGSLDYKTNPVVKPRKKEAE